MKTRIPFIALLAALFIFAACSEEATTTDYFASEAGDCLLPQGLDSLYGAWVNEDDNTVMILSKAGIRDAFVPGWVAHCLIGFDKMPEVKAEYMVPMPYQYLGPENEEGFQLPEGAEGAIMYDGVWGYEAFIMVADGKLYKEDWDPETEGTVKHRYSRADLNPTAADMESNAGQLESLAAIGKWNVQTESDFYSWIEVTPSKIIFSDGTDEYTNNYSVVTDGDKLLLLVDCCTIEYVPGVDSEKLIHHFSNTEEYVELEYARAK